MVNGTLVLIFTFTINFASAQKQANVWYFGDHIGLDFNEEPPILLMDGMVTVDDRLGDAESAASISDSSGNLLFYTDGVHVWQRNHQLMPNGIGLLGEGTTTQTLIVPWPEHPDLYFIFTASPQGNDEYVPFEKKGFRYSIVDMSKNNGLGDVVEKNILLVKSTTEKIAGTQHANGRDVWVAMHEADNNVFKVFLITPNGIMPPIISETGQNHSSIGTEYNYNAIGQMKFSPDGQRLALALYDKHLAEIFHFNPLTGHVSRLVTLSGIFDPYRTYGVEFSQNSQMLYVSDASCFIYQFSLEANNVANSLVTLENNISPKCTSPSQLQLGPDGKIYIAMLDWGTLGVIHNPDTPGKECNYQTLGVPIPADTVPPRHASGQGLPNFISSYFYKPELYPPPPYFEMPNVFTPNADGYNDLFKPLAEYNAENIDLKVYNRWGGMVYHSSGHSISWDGGNHTAGVYYWQAVVNGVNQREYSYRGYVQLVQ